MKKELWPLSIHLNLLIAGRELPLLKDEDVVSDPLQQQGDQLIILLPAQLQLLKHRYRSTFTTWRNIQIELMLF